MGASGPCLQAHNPKLLRVRVHVHQCVCACVCVCVCERERERERERESGHALGRLNNHHYAHLGARSTLQNPTAVLLHTL